MRAAEKALVSPTSPTAVRALLVRVSLAVLATMALLFVWHPVVIHAQAAPPTVLPDGMQPPAPAKQPPRAAAVRTDAKQDSATTHVVKAGETLWSIATRYYGDGQQWRAVARRNGIALSSDTAVRVGTVLIMPSRRTVASAVSARPAPIDTTTPKAVMTPAGPALPPPVQTMPARPATPRPTGALASQTAGKANAGARTAPAGDRAARVEAAAPRVAVAADQNAAQDTAALTTRSVLRPQIKAERLLTNGASNMILVNDSTLRMARGAREVNTVFLRQVPTASEALAATRVAMSRNVIAPRHGEYLAAPFVVADDLLLKAGRLVRRVDSAGPALYEASRVQLADEVEITAPVGATLSVGDRLLVVTTAASLADGRRVGRPAGVLVVTRASAPMRAEVRSQTGVIEQGQALLLVEGSAAPVGQQAAAVSGADVETRVTWIDDTSAQPTLQSYLLLGAGDAQGVKAGDEFALVRAAASGAEERVAVVRVVRTGAAGSTVVVVKQSQPNIAEGLAAKRIARVP